MGWRLEAVPAPRPPGEGHVSIGGGAKNRGAVRKGLGGAGSCAKCEVERMDGAGLGAGLKSGREAGKS